MEETLKTVNLEPSRRGFITNYPPFRRWKKTVAKDLLYKEPINIYVHIPFCMQRCAYCYYMTVSTKEKVDITGYVEAVCKEIVTAAKSFNIQDRPVNSIYIGGGTPTLLNEKQFSRLVGCIRDNLSIDDPEFTIEAEPVTLTERKANLLKSLGVNRLSMGVQSFDDDIIKLSERTHNEKQALKAIDIAQRTGDWVINIDLLSGLAGETHETWEYTLERALSVGVESITIYKMEAYSNTGFADKVQKEDLNLPNDMEEEELMKMALPKLKNSQYFPWCFFTFTKNGKFPNAYASSMFSGGDLYGFGASSFGKINRYVLQNFASLPNYLRAVKDDVLPIWRGHRLNSIDEIIRSILLGMKLTEINSNDFEEKYGVDLLALCSNELKNLSNKGYVSVEDGCIRMTSKGILYGDYVGKCLALGVSIRLGLSVKDENLTKTYKVWS